MTNVTRAAPPFHKSRVLVGYSDRDMYVFKKLLATAWLAVLATATVAQGQPSDDINYETARLDRRLLAVRTAAPLTLDGALDEASWREAPVAMHFIQNDPREGQPATFDTEVRVLYDDQALYLGVFAHDDDPSAIIVSDLKKDFNINTSDLFRVVLDTFNDGRNGYQFAVNPAGAKWDAQMANEGRENNANWDGIWDVKTRTVANGWYAEIWIPLRTLKFREANPQNWGVNFERRLRRLNEDSYGRLDRRHAGPAARPQLARQALRFEQFVHDRRRRDGW